MNKFNTKQVHTQQKDPPAILILKRQSIRAFPDGHRVALYYCDKLGKTITVPYDDMQWSSDEMKEDITDEDYKALSSLYESLNDENKELMLEQIKNKENFNTILKFALENYLG